MLGIHAGDFSFGDQRLNKRCAALLEAMLEKEKVQISSLSTDWASQMAAYRFVHNEKVSAGKIIDAMKAYTRTVSRQTHYLLLQDTTQPNFEWNRKNIKPDTGLGVIGNNKDLGFFLHPSLVVEADSQACIGFAHVHLWTRQAGNPDKGQAHYKSLPIAQKESYRWIESMQESKQVLHKADKITCVTDREGDIFDMFALLAHQQSHLLIRSRDDRNILDEAGEENKLYSLLESKPCGGVYELALKGDERKGRVARKAQIEVRYSKAFLKAPARLKKTYGQPIAVYAIEAKEVAPPPGQQGVHWRLLTTHQVESFGQALEIIHWYSLRWYIETLFRLLKKQGLQIETSGLEHGGALIKMVMLSLITALRVMILLLASQGESKQQIDTVFSPQEITCLQHLETKYRGKTVKQQNPHPKASLQWAAWIIARIGGWKALTSQGPFGVITLANGLKQFNLIFQGWIVAKDVYNT